jgi:hypothetical protein
MNLRNTLLCGTLLTVCAHSAYATTLSQISSGGSFVVSTDKVVTVRNGTTDALTTINGFLQAANNLSDLSSAAIARTNLGVAIGSNVEAWSTTLDMLAANLSANVVLGNSLNTGAMVSSLAMPACSSASNALIWTSGTGFGCNSSITASVPIATSSAVGMVKPDGTIITIASSGAITVPIMTSSVIGVAKTDGSTITATSSGIISATTATSSQLGVVKPDGTVITVSAGAITVPKATSSALGVVQVDNSTITVTSSGVISGSGGKVTSSTQYQMGYYAATGTTIQGYAKIITDSTGDLFLTSSGAGMGIGVSSLQVGDFVDFLGTTSSRIAHFGITTDQLANFASSCTTCFYMVLDKPATGGDVQTVYSDQGLIKWTAGMNADDNYKIQQVAGSSISSFAFTNVMEIFTSSRNVGFGIQNSSGSSVDPGFLLAIGTSAPATFDYSGNFLTSGSIGCVNTGGNCIITTNAEKTSGNGAWYRVRNAVDGTIGYLGADSGINGGTAYDQFDLQAAQSNGVLCMSAGGISSCGIQINTDNTIAIGAGSYTPVCGTNCSSITTGSTPVRGSFVIASSAVNTAKILWTSSGSSVLSSTPFCTVSDNSTAAQIDISAVSTSSLTISLSTTLSSVTVYYHCLQ